MSVPCSLDCFFFTDNLYSWQVTENIATVSPTKIANIDLTNSELNDRNPQESVTLLREGHTGQQWNTDNATNQVNNDTVRDIATVATDVTARMNISNQLINAILIGNHAHFKH